MAVDPSIAREWYFTAADGIVGADTDIPIGGLSARLLRLTICVIEFADGRTCVGESGDTVATPEIGRKTARQCALTRWRAAVRSA